MDLVKDKTIDLKVLMTPEMAIGALIYAVMSNHLTNKAIELARTVTEEYYDSLGDQRENDWDIVGMWVHNLRSLPLDERGREHIQAMLKSAIYGTAHDLENISNEIELSTLIDVSALMTPERILGAVVWGVATNTLNADLIRLAQTLPREYYQNLEGEWGMVGKFVHVSGPLDKRSLEYIQYNLAPEIKYLAQWAEAGRPKPKTHPYDWVVEALITGHLTGDLSQETIDEGRNLPIERYDELLGDGFVEVGKAIHNGADLETVDALIKDYFEGTLEGSND